MKETLEEGTCSYPFGVPLKYPLMAPKELKFSYTGHGQAKSKITYFSVVKNIPHSHLGMYQKYVLQVWDSIRETEFDSINAWFRDGYGVVYQILLLFFSQVIVLSDYEYNKILTKAKFYRGLSTDIVEAFTEAGVLSEEQIIEALRVKDRSFFLTGYSQEKIAEMLETEILLANMDILGYDSLSVFLRREEDIANIIRNNITDFKDVPTEWVLKTTGLDNLLYKDWDEVSWLKNLL